MSLTAFGVEQIARRLYHPATVYRPLPGPEQFSDAHLEQFRRDGFVAVENVFTRDEVDAAKAGLTHLIKGGNPDFKGVQIEDDFKDAAFATDEEREAHVRKCMFFVDHDARLKAMAYHPAVLAIVERIVGTKVNMIQDMALLKPAHVGREKPWHQDTAYFLYQPLDLILGTWTALDDATVENGCMHVIPGSHLGGPRAHYHDRDCQLPDEDVRVEQAVAVPLRAGGMLFFSGLMHHGTPPNRSPQRRRALQFHYASVDCVKQGREEHEKQFKDDGGYAGCAHWAWNAPGRSIETRKDPR